MKQTIGAMLVWVVVTLGIVIPLSAQTQAPMGSAPFYRLDQFGPVTDRAQVEQTYQKAMDTIIAAGGGVLIIPDAAAQGWVPSNNSQKSWRTPPPPAPATRWGQGKGVTVVDGRSGTTKILPPQETGLQINRTLNLKEGEASLGFWGYYPIVSMRNNILNGSCSYREGLVESVGPGKDQKFYVPTIRGIFPGMFMSANANRLFVKTLGYDKTKRLWYFTADNEMDTGKGTLSGNKNHVNILDLDTESHNENQTFDLRLWRHNYSQGDNYLVDARFKYMSDVHSTGGDENGVIFAAFTEAMTAIFRAKVASWKPETGELQFKESPSNPPGKTLGSGRPIINMNPAKWITKGIVHIVRPASWTDYTSILANPVYQGKSYPTTLSTNNPLGWTVLRMGGLIRFSADAPITDEVIGRYFAVDEEGEYVPRTDKVRRWYLIDNVTRNADGTKDIEIIRHWWGAKPMGAPTLYKEDNYSEDGHDRPLKYIIAPGANAYNVAEGVDNPKAIIKLVPTPFSGTPADFAANDPIEQAIGPDPFQPIPFRSWLSDVVPGAFPAPVFDVSNMGVGTIRDSVLFVHGGDGNIATDKARKYDQKPYFDKMLAFDSTCNNGIRFGADTANSALLFVQPHERAQPIKWNYRPETNQPAREATLTVSPKTGDMSFTGNASFDGSVKAKGISGGDTPARNLRGLNLQVAKGSKELTVKFPQAETDNAYMVVLQLSWLSNHAIPKRTAEGFTVAFATPPADAGELSWLLVR